MPADPEDRQFDPERCAYWQTKRIPHSPLRRNTAFLRWIQGDDQDNYRKRGNQAVALESVGYEFNRFGYRSGAFRREPGAAATLFLGDDFTFGVGVPFANAWSTIVADRLAAAWGIPVQQFNLAFPGAGPDHAAMLLHQSVDLLEPDAVFILWPRFASTMWFPNASGVQLFAPDVKPGEYAREYRAYLELTTPAQAFFNYVRDFHFVDDRLARLSIPYFWSNVEPFPLDVLEHYVPLDRFVGAFETVDKGRDNVHPGIASHARFGELAVAAAVRSGVGVRPRV
jgi:hypothetical protein